MLKLHSSQGYVALVGVLVIAAGCSIAIFASLLGATTNLQMVQADRYGTVARNNAHTCAEMGLQQLRDDTAYLGSGSGTFATGSCTYTVASTGTTTRSVTTTGISGDSTKRLTVSATIGTSSISVSFWREQP